MNCPHCHKPIPYAVDTREAGSKGRAVNSPAQQEASRNNGAAPVRPGKAPRGRPKGSKNKKGTTK